MRRDWRSLLLTAVLGSALLVAACSGGGNGEPSGNGSGNGDGITIELGPGFSFNPNEVTVAQGEQVTLRLHNVDSQPHDLLIDELNVDSGRLNGGEQDSVSFTANEVGEYEFYCSVPGHREGGMVGTLIVE